MLYEHDLTRQIHQIGGMGRLNCIETIQIVAGDKMRLNLDARVFTSPMRQEMKMPMHLDFYVYFNPMRYIVNNHDAWVKSCEKGESDGLVNETITTTPFGVNRAGSWIHGYPMTNFFNGIFFRNYFNVWNNYFKDPAFHQDVSILNVPNNIFEVNDDANFLSYGQKCCNLKSYLTTPISEVDDSSYEYDLSGDTIDFRDFAEHQAQTNVDVEEEYEYKRYRKLLPNVFHGKTTADVDRRPHFLAHQRVSVGANSVTGTSGDNQGQKFSTINQSLNVNTRNMYFGEHGLLSVFCLARFEPVFTNFIPFPFKQDINIDFDDFFCDPRKMRHQRLQAVSKYDITDSEAITPEFFNVPAYQHLRTGTSHANETYNDLRLGFPFTDARELTTKSQLIECPTDAWENVFQNNSLGHYRIDGKLELMARRVVPPAGSSVFVGTGK